MAESGADGHSLIHNFRHGAGIVAATSSLEVGFDLTPAEEHTARRVYQHTYQDLLRVFASHDLGKRSEPFQRILKSPRKPSSHHKPAKERVREAAEALRGASSDQAQACVAEFLEALAGWLAYRVSYARRSLIELLAAVVRPPQDCPVWIPTPTDTSPRVTPRGPNLAFPVSTYRGGHYRSTLGSVVLAA